ncbi:MAG: PepSY-associated TM helix domain-containing protein [Comamonadaceae bacterium]|nr:PepSY-associated TM helix domain-containing protein [Comamonadaceae bacterium]
MRPDAKPEGLRQAMSWLHTWSGLLLGWLLFAIFFTGTFSYMRSEIDDWMRPELHASAPAAAPAQAVSHALQALERLAPQADSWTIALPSARQTALVVSWRAPQRPRAADGAAGAASGAPPARAGQSTRYLDAATGQVLTPRQTRGGGFFYRFHFELYGLPRLWARWLVGIAAMAMFVAIISGVITHKKIFSDFFTFRPGKGQRSWLDAHNASAVLALPFHIVITFSGLLLLANLLMPWPTQAVYKGDTTAYFMESRGLAPVLAPAATAGRAPAMPAGAERGPSAQQRLDAPAISAAALQDLLAQAQAQWPERGVGRISIQAPYAPGATVELREGGGEHLSAREHSARSLRFDAHGAPLPAAAAAQPSWVRASYHVLVAPHLGRFAEPAVRWLLFLSGLLGCVMVGSGMVLWVVKRLSQRAKQGDAPRGHRLVERLNVAAIAGLCVAAASYFWLNRLLPASLADRALWEIRGFFLLWLLCALHPWLRSHRRAWQEQMAAAAVLWALLPLLNPLTGGAAWPSALARQQWGVASVDAIALLMAAACGAIGWQLGRAQAKARQAQAAKATQAKAAQGNAAAASLTAQERSA